MSMKAECPACKAYLSGVWDALEGERDSCPSCGLDAETMRAVLSARKKLADKEAPGQFPVHDDPVVQLLAVMARMLAEWPPRPPAEGVWDPTPFLPGGSRYIPKLTTYGTPVSPMSVIPFKTESESRDEAAAKVLAVLQEHKPQARKRRLPRLPCPPWADDDGALPCALTWR